MDCGQAKKKKKMRTMINVVQLGAISDAKGVNVASKEPQSAYMDQGSKTKRDERRSSKGFSHVRLVA